MAVSNKQSNESGVTARLIELIGSLTESQQQALLNMLRDWHNLERRKHARKSCVMSADYACQGRAYNEYIKDISGGGVFIETARPCFLGREITLTFCLPENQKPVKLKGKVAWTGTNGIGVQFENEDEQLESMLKSFS